MCSGACLHPWGAVLNAAGWIQELAHLCMGGKCRHHPWVWETTRTSGVVMMVSLCPTGCKDSGFNTSFVMSILLPQRESCVVGIFLFSFPLSVLKWKVKEPYLKKIKPHAYLLFIVCQERGHSLSARESDLFCPQTSVYTRNPCCSVPLTFIGSTVVSVYLKISDNSFSVSQ